MKKIMIVIIMVIIGLAGYAQGINRATTSDGWIDNDMFILEVNGHIYEWDISEE